MELFSIDGIQDEIYDSDDHLAADSGNTSHLKGTLNTTAINSCYTVELPVKNLFKS